MPRARFRLAWRRCATAALLCGAAAQACAREDAPLRAAIVVNLLLYVQWPGEATQPAGAPLHLCAAPRNPLWPHLRALQDRAVRQWRLELRELPAADIAAACHAWVIDAGNPAELQRARQLAAAPVLVVGDSSQPDDGAVIRLDSAAGRVVFDVDLAVARRNGLLLSSKLLRLARSIRE